LDGIHDLEKVTGLEELLRCLELVSAVDEGRLLSYLTVYGNRYCTKKPRISCGISSAAGI
jgi:hypothetical protein